MKQPNFVSTTAFDSEHPRALAIYCSDGRFTEAVEELLRHGDHPRLDTLTVPGGAALLHPWRATMSESDSILRAATFLIRSHRIQTVVLLAHESCGYYRANYPGRTLDELRMVQVEDLHEASRILLRGHDALEVYLFFARPDGGRVAFERVTG